MKLERFRTRMGCFQLKHLVLLSRFSQVGLNPAHCYEKDIKHPQLCQTCCKEPECNFIKPIEQQIKEAEAEVAKNPERKNSAGSASKKISFENISTI